MGVGGFIIRNDLLAMTADSVGHSLNNSSLERKVGANS
jgi:hypothetical protein